MLLDLKEFWKLFQGDNNSYIGGEKIVFNNISCTDHTVIKPFGF